MSTERDLGSYDPRVMIALDYPDTRQALALVDQLDARSCGLKVGLQLYVAAGPGFIETLHKRGFRVFLDLKFHDIPNTVASACAAAADLGVSMMTLHAGGGAAMLEAAREAVDKAEVSTRLLAVTVLTSSSVQTLREIGVDGAVDGQVARLGTLAMRSGMSGLVCSAQEAAHLRSLLGGDALLVTPGIRLADSGSAVVGDDQHRVMTPRAAFVAGASHIVVGRPVTQAADPEAVIRRILEEISAVAGS